MILFTRAIEYPFNNLPALAIIRSIIEETYSFVEQQRSLVYQLCVAIVPAHAAHLESAPSPRDINARLIYIGRPLLIGIESQLRQITRPFFHLLTRARMLAAHGDKALMTTASVPPLCCFLFLPHCLSFSFLAFYFRIAFSLLLPSSLI